MMLRWMAVSVGLISACASSGASVKVDEPALLAEVNAICESDKSGSELWDAHIMAALVRAADANQSGDLDTPDEVSAVPCSVWRRMELGIQQDQESAFMTIYGFHPRLIWVGSAVGINQRLQAMATKRLSGCGLDAGMD